MNIVSLLRRLLPSTALYILVLTTAEIAVGDEVNTVQLSARIVTDYTDGEAKKQHVNIFVENLGRAQVLDAHPVVRAGQNIFVGTKANIPPGQVKRWSLSRELPVTPGRLPILAEVKYHDITGVGAATIALGEVVNGALPPTLPVIVSTSTESPDNNVAEFRVENLTGETQVVRIQVAAASFLRATTSAPSLTLKPYESSIVLVRIIPPPFRGTFPVALIASWDSEQISNFTHAATSISPKASVNYLFFLKLLALSIFILAAVRISSSYMSRVISLLKAIFTDD